MSTLLFIAGDDTGKIIFEQTLLKQVSDLRKELEGADVKVKEPESTLRNKTCVVLPDLPFL